MERYRLVAVALGLVLLVASVMKYLALTEVLLHPQLITGEWWLLLGSFTFEVILGLWLVSALYPFAARNVSVLCFAAFALISFVKGSRGEASCGCFGSVEVNPWITFAFDLLATTALLSFTPAVRPNKAGVWAVVAMAGIVVFGLGAGGQAYESVTHVSRNLLVSKVHHEFGYVRQSQSLTHVFRLENRCRYAVEITEAGSTCFCTKLPDVSGRVLQPGESLEVPVTLDTGESEEHIAGGAKLFCRKAGSTVAPVYFGRLVVSAKVDPDYRVGQVVVDFGKVRGGERPTRQVRVRPHRMPEVRIDRVESLHPAFRGAVANRRAADGDHVIELTFDGKDLVRSGGVTAPLIVHTSSPKSPTFRLLAQADYQSPFEVDSSAVVVGSDVRGEAERAIRVSGPAPLAIGTLQSSDGVRVTAKRLGAEGKEWQVVVTVAEGNGKGLNGEARFEVYGEGVRRQVAIPVHRFSSVKEAKQ